MVPTAKRYFTARPYLLRCFFEEISRRILRATMAVVRVIVSRIKSGRVTPFANLKIRGGRRHLTLVGDASPWIWDPDTELSWHQPQILRNTGFRAFLTHLTRQDLCRSSLLEPKPFRIAHTIALVTTLSLAVLQAYAHPFDPPGAAALRVRYSPPSRGQEHEGEDQRDLPDREDFAYGAPRGPMAREQGED